MKKVFGIAALLLALAACNKVETEITPVEQPSDSRGITITATLAPKTNGAATRAVSDQSTYIKAEWAVDEHIAILYNKDGAQVANATITALDGSTGAATISFTVESGTADNTACTLVYPASAAKDDNSGVKTYAELLATQDGVLDGDLDVRVGAGTIQTTTPGLTVSTQPAAQYSIFKFTAQDISGTGITPTEFKVSDASGNVITTVNTSSSAFYVALPALTTGTYWFNATASSKPYIAKATVSTATEAGKYYQSTVKMATLGDLMGQDGKFYADADAITAANTKAIGVIAHIGNDATTEAIANGGGHGLVLCLKNALSNVSWSTNTSSQAYTGNAYVSSVEGLTRTEGVSGYAATAALATVEDAVTIYPAAYQAKNYTGLKAPTGTTGWFLPSAQQWVKMQTGLGGLSESSITWRSWFDPDHTAAGKWEAALSKAGSGNYDSMTERSYFWSSSEYSAYYAVLLDVVATGTGNVYGFYWYNHGKDYTEGNSYRVRPVLAF